MADDKLESEKLVLAKAKMLEEKRKALQDLKQRNFLEGMQKLKASDPVVMPEARPEFLSTKTSKISTKPVMDSTKTGQEFTDKINAIKAQRQAAREAQDINYKPKKDIELGNVVKEYSAKKQMEATNRGINEAKALSTVKKSSGLVDELSNVIPISKVAGKLLKKVPGALGMIPSAIATGTTAYHLLRGDNAAAADVVEENTIPQDEYIKDQTFDSGLMPEGPSMEEIQADSQRRLELKRKALESLRNK